MAPPHEKARDSSPIRYHSRYNDPTADMVIKSIDGMHFRVQSYHMKSYSTYFREMPDFDTAINGNTPKDPIDLEITQAELANTLQLHDVDAPSTLTWGTIACALEAGEKYGFHSLPAHVAAKANRRASDAPWAVFEFASQHDFYALAKLAISFFHHELRIYRHRPADYPTAIFKKVPGDYVTALYRAIGPKYMASLASSDSDWAEVAGRFRL